MAAQRSVEPLTADRQPSRRLTLSRTESHDFVRRLSAVPAAAACRYPAGRKVSASMENSYRSLALCEIPANRTMWPQRITSIQSIRLDRAGSKQLTVKSYTYLPGVGALFRILHPRGRASHWPLTAAQWPRPREGTAAEYAPEGSTPCCGSGMTVPAVVLAHCK